ncbi:unnamed protein product [Orchesella dallaii]|uniref:Uncharacterized protein n=1 Tax=Orchesella dallaii TaxID=48710 RepID=A0ABP1RDB8_9HEXA
MRNPFLKLDTTHKLLCLSISESSVGINSPLNTYTCTQIGFLNVTIPATTKTIIIIVIILSVNIMLQVDATVILLEVVIVALFLVWFIVTRLVCRCIYDYGSVSLWCASMMENKMYFACCRSKSVSHENLHEDGSAVPRVRRPNPIIVGLANHLREHHSSTRNSAMAGCFGFPDSPPRYEDIYSEARSSAMANRHYSAHTGVCNIDGTKEMMAEETIQADADEVPPPSYEESVGMSSSTSCMVTITIEKESLKENFT